MQRPADWDRGLGEKDHKKKKKTSLEGGRIPNIGDVVWHLLACNIMLFSVCAVQATREQLITMSIELSEHDLGKLQQTFEQSYESSA